MKRYYLFSTVLMLTMWSIGQVQADLIDFEGIVQPEGSSVPVIEGVIFNASVAVQGSPEFAFGVVGGVADTGYSAPFSNSGNIFITNPGGYASDEMVKQILIDFPIAVSELSFLVADIDSLQDVMIEQLTAKVFDTFGNELDTIVYTAPEGNPRGGDGEVVLIDFGTLSGITQLQITNESIFNPLDSNTIGWGVDNLSFTPVPIPGAFILGILGLGTASIKLRRKKEV